MCEKHSLSFHVKPTTSFVKTFVYTALSDIAFQYFLGQIENSSYRPLGGVKSQQGFASVVR